LHGITAYGAYLPIHRLDLSDVAATLGSAGRPGARIVAGPDEDTTTMAVEAARQVARRRPVDCIWLATTRPAYLEKTNAALVHAALGLDPVVAAYDVGGAIRSGAGALAAAMRGGGMAVLADLRVGLPESDEERGGADAAAAFAFGDDGVIAEIAGSASATLELLDRWRLPDATSVEVWDDRFSLDALTGLALDVASSALKHAGLERTDHVAVATGNPRLAGALASRLGAGNVALQGFAGAAHVGVVLADLLDRLQPGETALVLAVADGADAFVVRATDLLVEARQDHAIADQTSMGRPVAYASYLTWRGVLRRQPPRRPDPQAPAAPPSLRESAWKHALVASRCTECGRTSLPPQRVCPACGAVDAHEAVPVSDREATVATVTVDRLAYSLSPPVVMAVVDIDGGGRLVAEVADADPDDIRIGTRLEPTFRRLATSEGIHNYFWKLRPLRSNHGK
jgi:hydroxymethylglutaryl-CoA synthase